MSYWRKVAEYLGTDAITLMERVEAKPLYAEIAERAFVAMTAEREAREDGRIGKKG